MINRNSYSSESGQASRAALAVVGAALLTIMMSAAVAVVVKSTDATPAVSTAPAATGNEPFVYFPAQYVNQARDIEPMPPTF